MMLTGVASPLAAWMIGRLGVRVTLFIGGIGVAAINFAMAVIGDSYASLHRALRSSRSGSGSRHIHPHPDGHHLLV